MVDILFMLFDSVGYLIFFPIVVFFYYLLPHRFRWVLLLLASLYFYMAFMPKYILIPIFIILVDYVLGILIEKKRNLSKVLLFAGVVLNLLPLLFYKYFNFFIENLDYAVDFFGWNYSVSVLKIILPIGLSFYVFQSMGYLIEIYWGKQKAERHIGILATYVLFYPQLVAGPIERPQNLIPQFKDKHRYDVYEILNGLKLIAWGLFKKVVIADRLAIFVNEIFNNVYEYNGLILVIGVVFFAFQIYCDFSGYCDIAIGSARVMGFKLMENFNRPYLSASISEFWRSWHMSLYSWFKDYVYIPLGGNRLGKIRQYINIMIVFILSGFWHGANWNFVLWGSINGAYLVVENFVKIFFTSLSLIFFKLNHSIKVIITFVLVSFTWIFFRSNNFIDSIYVVTNIFVGWSSTLEQLKIILFDSVVFGRGLPEFIIAFFAIVSLVLFEIWQGKNNFIEKVNNHSKVFRLLFFSSIVFAILFLGIFKEQQFIYFQF